VPLRSASLPRKRLLVNLSQAVEELGLRKAPKTHVVPLDGALDGNVKVQFFEVDQQEFDRFENISKALIRLDQGTYGRCTSCGGRIEPDVLADTPLATLCLDCWDQDSQA
jgi:RNA polymerase-binding transcription factor DksA